jgi:hypothetical protein
MKTKSITIIALFLYTIVLNSCKKDLLKTCIEGKVKNIRTGESIANRKVFLVNITRICFFGCGNSKKIIKGTTTDANGNYKFEFKAENKNYEVTAISQLQDDTLYYKSESKAEIVNKKNNHVDIELHPTAYINFRFLNLSAIDSGTFLKYELFQNGESAYKNTLISKDINNTDRVKITLGVESNNKLAYSYIRNGIEENRDTSVFVKSFETKTINIKL